tara:strand:+ start:42633 stop:43613 length:981 start_codon:yes stop_codon:yes gene_type:complete
MKIYLVTGGCGFIGSYVVGELLKDENNFIYVIDKMGIGSSPDNIIGGHLGGHPRVNYIFRDIAAADIAAVLPSVRADYVIHLAAESHVDRSIEDSSPFVQSNVAGTVNILNYVKDVGARMVHVSTDEVYGHLDLTSPPFRESDPLQPRSPYAASKAASDLFVQSYFKTYHTDVSITRCCNNYGPRQHDEKLIPTIIRAIISGKKIPIYGNGMNIREWIHAKDHAAAIIEVLYMDDPGTVFNIPGSKHLTNIDITRNIIGIVENQLPSTKREGGDYIEFVVDRAGHDFRYAVATQYDLESVKYQQEFCLEDTVAHYIKKYSELKQIL